MLNSYMNSLLDNLVTNLLVHFHADGSLGDVPDNACAAMVELVRHPFVNRTIDLNVHVLTYLVGPQICADLGVSLLPEGPGEQIPRPSAHSMACPHCLFPL